MVFNGKRQQDAMRATPGGCEGTEKPGAKGRRRNDGYLDDRKQGGALYKIFSQWEDFSATDSGSWEIFQCKIFSQ